MKSKVDIEFALRSACLDMLDLANELGVGAINVYADTNNGNGSVITGMATSKKSHCDVVSSFMDFPDEREAIT